MPVEDLKQSPMMAHLMSSMEHGQDIGHYGRLTFIMVGRHFLSDEELTEFLTKDPDCDNEKAHGLIQQVKARGYNPPKPERILQWMDQQEFPICNNEDGNAEACNVYKSLNFPPEVYEKISSYYEHSK